MRFTLIDGVLYKKVSIWEAEEKYLKSYKTPRYSYLHLFGADIKDERQAEYKKERAIIRQYIGLPNDEATIASGT